MQHPTYCLEQPLLLFSLHMCVGPTEWLRSIHPTAARGGDGLDGTGELPSAQSARIMIMSASCRRRLAYIRIDSPSSVLVLTT